MLLGSAEENFSPQVMSMLSNFDSFVVPINRNKISPLQLVRDEEYIYEINEDLDFVIRVPKGSRAKQFGKTKEYYDVKIKYDIWPVILDRWARTLEA